MKLLLSLLVAGWEGYERTVRRQVELGDALRGRLAAAGWEVVNATPLPVVCFVDGRTPEGRSGAFLERVAAAVVGSGEAWISTTRLGETGPALRACITCYATAEPDLDALVAALGKARQRLATGDLAEAVR
jgi:glutamate/tyrosine decarboxylase-like PLP-dependent enzyme